MAGEAPRVAPSRAKRGRKKPREMPLLVVANSPDKEAALAGPRKMESKAPRGGRVTSPLTTCWSIPCAGARPPGLASGSTSGTSRKRFGRNRKRPTLMTIRRANGGRHGLALQQRVGAELLDPPALRLLEQVPDL